MRISEILRESNRAPLYHATTLSGAISILTSGEIRSHDTQKGRPYISTTRNPRLRYSNKGQAPVQFVLDAERIAQRAEVRPDDYWYRWSQKMWPGDKAIRSRTEAEERVWANTISLACVTSVILEPVTAEGLATIAMRDHSTVVYAGKDRHGDPVPVGIKPEIYDAMIQQATEHGIKIIDRRIKTPVSKEPVRTRP